MAFAYPLAALTIVISLWPAPFLLAAARLAGFPGAEGVPQFETPWAAPVLAPYIGGFLVYLIGRVSARARDAAAVLLALATVAVVALEPSLDPASRLFALLFSGVAALMIVYSLGYIGRAATSNRYYFFAFLMTGSLIGLTTAHEFGNFYVFWELMTWTSYFLVVHQQTPKALTAGLVYFLMCAAGAYVMLFGILLLHAQIGSFEFAALADKVGALPPTVGAAIVICFFLGFAVKMGLFPLQSWLPLAHPEAPSSISGPLSGILTKAGLFGVVKVLYVAFGAGALARFVVAGLDVGSLLTALGCVTLIYGEIRALFERDLKRMLAFSTIAQIGEIAAILGIGAALATDAALLHVTNHAVMKTLLFYAAGAFIVRTGGRRLEDLAGLGRVMPFTAGAYALASFAIMGLPPFSGFVSKFLMIYAAAVTGHVAVAALMLLGGIIAVVYYTRVVSYLFYYPYKGGEGVREAPAPMLVAIGVLAAAILFGGVAPGAQLALVSEVGDLTALRGAIASGPLPGLVADWPAGAAIAMAGAILVLLVGYASAVWAGRLAVATLVVALVAVIAEHGRYDLLSFGFAVLIAGVGALNMLHSTAYLAHSHAQGRFFAAFTVMVAGLIGMTQAKDIFSFFAFWELMSSWALWAAISHEETSAARREGFKYFLFNTVGASFLFLGLAWIGAEAQTFELASIGSAICSASAGLDRAANRSHLPRLRHEGGDAAGAYRLSDAPRARADADLRLHLGGAAEERPVGRAQALCAVRRRGAVRQARRRSSRPTAAARRHFDHRRRHHPLCRRDGGDPERHQAAAHLFDGVPARLRADGGFVRHVAGRRGRTDALRQPHVAEGHAVSGRRRGDGGQPRDEAR